MNEASIFMERRQIFKTLRGWQAIKSGSRGKKSKQQIRFGINI
jgi:predicted RNA-binding protein Jag